MFEYKKVKPITNIPLSCFKAGGLSRDRDLYDLRLGAVRADGYFMLRMNADESCAASFNLEGDHLGTYLLGQVVTCPSSVNPEVIYYEAFVHGGSRDATSFCRSPEELLDLIKALEGGVKLGPERHQIFEMFDNERIP